jgi:hypothetical protein
MRAPWMIYIKDALPGLRWLLTSFGFILIALAGLGKYCMK